MQRHDRLGGLLWIAIGIAIALSPHTVEHSLSVHGKTERLPDENILEINMMCGYHRSLLSW
jgi:hypothetical protein